MSIELLEHVALRLGWCHLGLLWARPGMLARGMTFVLHLQALEQLQFMMRLCKWVSRCTGAEPPVEIPTPAAAAAVAAAAAAAALVAGAEGVVEPEIDAGAESEDASEAASMSVNAAGVLQDVWLDGHELNLITGPGAPSLLTQVRSMNLSDTMQGHLLQFHCCVHATHECAWGVGLPR